MAIVKSGHGDEEEIMGKTILVVDDEREMRSLLKDSLTIVGYNVLPCENGGLAIEYISKADLLITDFSMPPGINGAELTEIAKRQKPGLPVIIMTADPGKVPANHLADKVINKPFRVEELKKVIADLLQTHKPRAAS